MGIAYFAVCMDCKTGIILGNPVRRDYKGIEEESTGLTSFTFEEGDTNEHLLRKTEILEHFLVMHRSHEIRILPETVDQYSTHIGIPQSFPLFDDDPSPEDNRLVFLRQPVGTLDPQREADDLPPDVVSRLKEF